MNSIPVAICRFSDNNFKRLLLKKEDLYEDFLLHFRNVHEIWNILKKKKSILGKLLLKLLRTKEMFT